MNIIKLKLAVAALAAGMALAGCGGGAPGDADVRAAMEKQIARIAGSEGVASQKDELAKIKVGKCAKADLGGFTCSFGTGAGSQTGRFLKGDKGWELVGVGG